MINDDIKEKEFISNENKLACCGAYGFSSYKELYKYAKKIIDDNYLVKNEYYISSVSKYYFSLGTPEQIKIFEYNFLLDGTLVDTDDLYIEIWNELFKINNT